MDTFKGNLEDLTLSLTYLKASARFTFWFFTFIFGVSLLMLIILSIHDYSTEKNIQELKGRYQQVEQLRSQMIDAISREPQVAKYAGDVRRVNLFLNKQMEESLNLEQSKATLTRTAFITILVFLLLSWLIILRLLRQNQEALAQSYSQLKDKTLALEELTQTLERKVEERTQTLAQAKDRLQKAFEDLKTAQAQLLQSEKFSAIGELAGGIAHEINNPVGFIYSNLQTLERYLLEYRELFLLVDKLYEALGSRQEGQIKAVADSLEQWKKHANYEFIQGDLSNLLKESMTGVERIRRIIKDLHTFARPDKEVMESVKIEAILESMINIMWNELKYKIVLHKDYGLVPPMTCNPQKISQVFVNLLMNAAQSIKDKGTITVKTYTRNDSVYIEISDTGCGIAPQYLTKIFDPFFTTKPVGQGIGLGLSTSYDIVKKQGGSLTVESKVGEGSTFTVRLPLQLSENLVAEKGGI